MKKFNLVLLLVVLLGIFLVGCKPEHVHAYEEEVVAPTCTESGYTVYTCECGDTYTDNETPALGHTWGEVIVDEPATEEKEGKGHRVCSVCGEEEEVTIEKLVYVWKTVSTEANQDAFVFDEETEELKAINATDRNDLWLNMYAIKYESVEANEAYSVEATFTPTGENNVKGAERTYGLVVWYQDSDNFLLYWLQQKDGGNWSGQFYGKVNGENRNFVTNPEAAEWSTNEWDDMWWDNNTANPEIRSVAHTLLDSEVTLRVVSEIVELDNLGTARAFELHQIVNGVDHISRTYYIKDVHTVEGVFRTGVYANNFDLNISNFKLETGLWKTVSEEENETLFVFDEVNGDLKQVNATLATDPAALWLNMYAIYNVSVMGDYTVETTFTPTGENNVKGAERTYGILAWYVDSDNFLIYWLQQKDGGNWSGQFYGKVNGEIRNFVTDPAAETWITNEWNDMWWDGGTAHPKLRSQTHILLTQEVTLKVVSKVETLDNLGTVRSFELHQIVDGEDFISSTYYIKDAHAVEGDIFTGIYVNNIDVAVKFN